MNDIVTAIAEATAGEQAEIPDLTADVPTQCPMQDQACFDAPLEHTAKSAGDGGTGDGPTGRDAKVPIRDEATSQHLAGTVELLVIAPLKQGLINVRDTLTYATRLRMLLRTLNYLRKARTEQAEDSIFVGPMDRLQTIHHVSWTMIENDQKMLMSVVFDQALEPYIRKLVGDGWPVLNAILCHCEGYDGDKGYAAFTNFLRRHQAPVEITAATVPGLTVDDQRYLKELEHQLRTKTCPNDRDMAAAKLHVKAPFDPTAKLTDKIRRDNAPQALQVIAAMHRLNQFFPEPEDLSQFESTATAGDEQRERSFFLTLLKSMLPGFERSWIPDSHQLQARFTRELAWYEETVCATVKTEQKNTNSWDLESAWAPREKIQGNILAEYQNITHGCLLLLRLGNPESARSFLRSLQSRVTTGATEQGDTTLNIALTYNGLKTLGVTDAELVKFPKEFREGMQSRASLLGDLGTNHPSKWSLPKANWPLDAAETDGTVPLATVDLVIQLQKADVGASADKWLWCADHPLYKEVEELAERVEQTGGQLLGVEPLRRKLIDGNVHEHFGFRDGLSQPKPGATHCDSDRVALGEVLLGHANDHDDPVGDTRDPILHNSSFLVIRKLSQDVAAFEEFLNSQGGELGRDELAAKMVGRRIDGAPITVDEPDNYDFKNTFDYKADSDGLKCPFHAHIRRSNPRDGDVKGEPVPRIMRRGMAYGPRYNEDPDADRGLMFMAYNADIAQQFEVIQRWISGGNSTGVLSAHSDPLLGAVAPGHERAMSFAHNNQVLRYNLGNKPFVKLEWGMYMFVPSINSLEKLCEDVVSAKPYPPANLPRGLEMLKKFKFLDSIEDPADAKLRWKKLLEDISSRKYAEDMWAAIRAQGGAISTAYGFLVADEKLVLEVLHDTGNTFSVREYYSRMDQSTGAQYLGMDHTPQAIEGDSQDEGQAKSNGCSHADDYVAALAPVGCPKTSRYRHESAAGNAWIAAFSQETAFAHTREETEAWLDKRLISATGSEPEHGEISLQDLARDVFARLSVRWFGIPDGDTIQIGDVAGEKPHCPDDMKLAAAYIFSPNPTPFVEAKARQRGQNLLRAVEAYIPQAIAQENAAGDTLLTALHAAGADENTMARTLTGAVLGFVSPTTGSFFSVMNTWIKSKDLNRHQQAYRLRTRCGKEYAHAKKVLLPALIRAMQERSAPALLHRTAVKPTQLGGMAIEAGERVVLGVVSAALQQLENTVGEADKTRILFGGNYGEKGDMATGHACPGQDMALGVLLGIVTTLFERSGTLQSTGGLVLSLNE